MRACGATLIFGADAYSIFEARAMIARWSRGLGHLADDPGLGVNLEHYIQAVCAIEFTEDR